MNDNILEVNNLKKYFSYGRNVLKIVDGLSFQLKKGSLTSIIGKSGSGKTTLLYLLGALYSPDEGSIIVEGQDITQLKGHKLNLFRREKIGFVFQDYNLIPNLSVLENVMLPLEFSGMSYKERKERAMKVLSDVGIERFNQRPTKLSGGEQQRVAIARALANESKLILADEPTGNLDSETSLKIIELLHNLTKQNGRAVLVVTHDQDISKLSDEVYHIKNGKLYLFK